MFKKPLWQTVWTQIRLLPIGAVCSKSTLFASTLNSSVMLDNYLQQTTSADDIFRCIFSWRFKRIPYKCIVVGRMSSSHRQNNSSEMRLCRISSEMIWVWGWNFFLFFCEKRLDIPWSLFNCQKYKKKLENCHQLQILGDTLRVASEMCPVERLVPRRCLGETGAPEVAKIAYSHKQSQKWQVLMNKGQ